MTAQLPTLCLLQDISSEKKGNCAIQIEYFPKEASTTAFQTEGEVKLLLMFFQIQLPHPINSCVRW
jgi:hypothetical protein